MTDRTQREGGEALTQLASLGLAARRVVERSRKLAWPFGHVHWPIGKGNGKRAEHDWGGRSYVGAAAETIVFDRALRLLLVVRNAALGRNRGSLRSAEIGKVRLAQTGHTEIAQRPDQHEHGNEFPQRQVHLPTRNDKGFGTSGLAALMLPEFQSIYLRRRKFAPVSYLPPHE